MQGNIFLCKEKRTQKSKNGKRNKRHELIFKLKYKSGKLHKKV